MAFKIPQFLIFSFVEDKLLSKSLSSFHEDMHSTTQAFFSQIFMHKSAMQMQHARDIQRNGPSAPGSGMGGEIKPHQCQQCLKSFSSNHQLVQHIRVHTGEKPYKCTYCDRRFKQLSHVQQHTRLHTGKSQMFSVSSTPNLRPSYFAKGKEIN